MNRRPLLAALPLLALPAQVRAQAVLPPGLSVLPGGGWRVAFGAGQTDLPRGLAPMLAEIGRGLGERPAGTGRVTIEAQASFPAEDASAARRLSLGRAEAVRQALAAGGLATNRVDLRPLGRTTQGLDCADILPPPGAQATDPARNQPARDAPAR
ncbi:hypothetical protein [Falsiroseomonas sp.]|uniref:hypothetical protein n=1 Tax=Falsiroseomonas sp. TaxID=2870721 RepID=UPI0034A1AB85